jgi:hypothetical protein
VGNFSAIQRRQVMANMPQLLCLVNFVSRAMLVCILVAHGLILG